MQSETVTPVVRKIRCVFIATCILVLAHCASAQPTTRPNIVLLLADDLGWTDIHTGATSNGNGSSYHQTPNIDRLATEGMSFSSVYMCPNCAPSRAALITGEYAVRNGVYNVTSLERGKGELQPAVQSKFIQHDAITVAETAGYTTCHVAKYHISKPEDITRFDGFDFNYGGGAEGSPRGYFALKDASGHWAFKALGPEMDQFALPYTKEYIDQNLKPFANGNDPSMLVDTPKHSTDADADAAIDFMTKHLASESDRDKPFFVNVAFNAVHVVVKSRPDLEAKYDQIKSNDPRHTHANYAALLEGEDQAIGRILKFLDDHKLTDHTLVIFLSDNGGFGGSTSNAPLRGSKGMFYEGGLRVPAIFRLPGVIKPGTSSDVMLNAVDFYPTFAEFARAKLPDASQYPLDGESFAPILRGSATSQNRRAIYYHFPGYLDTRAFPCSVIVKQADDGNRYKLFYSYEDKHYELYNLSADLSETKDLLKSKPSDATLAIANDLHDDLCHWLSSTHPLFAKDKSTGKDVRMPIAIKEAALAAGNKITREATAGKDGASD